MDTAWAGLAIIETFNCSTAVIVQYHVLYALGLPSTALGRGSSGAAQLVQIMWCNLDSFAHTTGCTVGALQVLVDGKNFSAALRDFDTALQLAPSGTVFCQKCAAMCM
jgi:hypothetical protein